MQQSYFIQLIQEPHGHNNFYSKHIISKNFNKREPYSSTVDLNVRVLKANY